MKNRANLPHGLAERFEELDLIPLIYYRPTDEDGPLRTTICLLLCQGKPAARGVAVCSYKDRFARKAGRAFAAARAYRATQTGLAEKAWPRPGSLESEAFGQFRMIRAHPEPMLTAFEADLVQRFLAARA